MAVRAGIEQAPERAAAAAVVRAPGAALDAEYIVDFLRQRLSSYKLPRQVTFFERAGLPALGNGKVDRKALSELLGRAAAQDGTRPETATVNR
jgi:acyl-CoA synthetase (AMP-forming)/AMP-acid ligase II